MSLLRFMEILTAITGVAMSFAYYPQAYRIFKTKSARDVSLLTYLLFGVGNLIWTTYGFLTGDWTIISGFAFGVVGAWLVIFLALRYRRSHP